MFEALSNGIGTNPEILGDLLWRHELRQWLLSYR